MAFLKQFFALVLVFVWSSGCSAVNPIIERKEKMNFKTLVQELSNAYPWTLDKVEKIIGKKLERPANLPSSRTEYEAKDITFDDDLIVDSVNIRASNETKELLTIGFRLKGDSSCITVEHLRKIFPNGEMDIIPAFPAPMPSYTVMQTWGGEVEFIFDPESKECLSNFHLLSPSFLKK